MLNHAGYKEVDNDGDFWADHDDNCHGNPDDLADDSDFEDGFKWSCCGEEVSAEGCIVSRHEAKEAVGAKKSRKILTPVSRNIVAGSSFRGPGGRQVL